LFILNKLNFGTWIAIEELLMKGGHKMSIHTKSSTALKENRQEESPTYEGEESHTAKIIPWPDIERISEKKEKRKKTRLEGKYLYYKGKKIPILQFQKAGYDKLLKLLVKEIER
jgi:hypothetical protein